MRSEAAMTPATYNRMTAAELRGRKATTTRSIENNAGRIPRGMIVTITQKRRGLSIEAAPCGKCKMVFKCSKVTPDALDLLP